MGKYSLPKGLSFEYLVALELRRILKVKARIDTLLGEAMIGRISPNLKARQMAGAKKAAALIGRHIAKLGKRPLGIGWSGPARPRDGSPVDIEVLVKPRTAITYSLKSIEGVGTGTSKNLGLDSMEALLATSFAREANGGFRVIAATLKRTPSRLSRALRSGRNWAQFKVIAHRVDPKGRDIANSVAKAAYRPIKQQITEKSVRAFNALPRQRKREVIEVLLGVWGGTHVVVSDKGGQFILDSTNLKKKLQTCRPVAVLNAGKNSWRIDLSSSDGTHLQVIRINSSATNRQGLSNPCQRSFIGKDGKDMFKVIK